MRIPPGIRPIVLAVCLLTAGCTGLVGSEVDRDPYGVDEPVEPTNDIGLAGVSGDRVTSWQALWYGHIERLTDTSYVRTMETTYVDANGTVLSNTTQRAVITADGREYTEHTRYVYDRATNVTTTRTTTQWVDGDQVTNRVVGERGEATVSSGREISNPATRLPVVASTLFTAVESVSVDRSGDRPRYVLTGSGNAIPYQNTTFTLILTERGVIEYLSLEGERIRNGEQVDVSVEHRIDRIGESIDLETPDWANETDDRDAE
ncbi:hypothetical protein [Natronosalvus vescus]|uniref:hypothetical protein n=1 Tax=Natronosalvus vescus TaxID=2953881 RepID=UPI002091935E|nr:hypothetical protein [Natronosalvus vescus]